MLAEGEVAIPNPAKLSQVRLTLPWHISTRRGRSEIIPGNLSGPRPDPTLIRALRNAHSMLRRDRTGMPVLDAAPATSYRLKLVRLAFLAPDILAGRQPPELSLAALLEDRMPLLWSAQRHAINPAQARP